METKEKTQCENCIHMGNQNGGGDKDGSKRSEWLSCQKIYVEVNGAGALEEFGCAFFEPKNQDTEDEDGPRIFQVTGVQKRYYTVDICAESEEEALDKFDSMGTDEMNEVGELEFELVDIDDGDLCDDE